MLYLTHDKPHHTPWNKGKLTGQKPPLKLNEVWAIRIRLQIANKKRDLALFNLALDSKLRSCDLVKLNWCRPLNLQFSPYLLHSRYWLVKSKNHCTGNQFMYPLTISKSKATDSIRSKGISIKSQRTYVTENHPPAYQRCRKRRIWKCFFIEGVTGAFVFIIDAQLDIWIGSQEGNLPPMMIASGVKTPIIETDNPRMVKIPPPTIPPSTMAISSGTPSALFRFLYIELLCLLVNVIILPGN